MSVCVNMCAARTLHGTPRQRRRGVCVSVSVRALARVRARACVRVRACGRGVTAGGFLAFLEILHLLLDLARDRQEEILPVREFRCDTAWSMRDGRVRRWLNAHRSRLNLL